MMSYKNKETSAEVIIICQLQVMKEQTNKKNTQWKKETKMLILVKNQKTIKTGSSQRSGDKTYIFHLKQSWCCEMCGRR